MLQLERKNWSSASLEQTTQPGEWKAKFLEGRLNEWHTTLSHLLAHRRRSRWERSHLRTVRQIEIVQFGIHQSRTSRPTVLSASAGKVVDRMSSFFVSHCL